MKQSTAVALAGIGVGGLLLARQRRRLQYSFANKTVVITGGSRGLGLVMARALSDEGARLVLIARDGEELQRAAEALAVYGRAPITAVCDITDPGQTVNTIAQVEARVGAIDVLINNAGVISVGPLENMTREDFEEALAVNFWGAYNMVEAVLPGMRQRQVGRIVNVSSIGGKLSVPHLVPYCVGKFALVGYSHGIRAELASKGIVVTTICPGLMRTGSPRNASFKGNHEAEYAWFKISDSLPLLTVSAEKAARATIEACRRGDAEAVISVPAQVGVFMQQVFPALTDTLTAFVNRLLPAPRGNGSKKLIGKESESAASSTVLTYLTDKAALRNNEVALDEVEVS